MDDSRSAPASVPRVNSQGPDPLIGRLINDRYKIVGIIARGGMGKVYRAEQAPLGRLVALKVLNPNYSGENDPEFHKRFFLEASIASKLTHPNTVTIFDYGKTDDDVYYIAMELLEGRTLHRALREEGPFDPERTMHIGRQICRSLREAHGLGVIHRDLKPANVYLVQHGDENDFVKVLDFGLVKNLDEKGEELTQTGLFMGSPKYMSPEQIRGEKVDSRVDVYALGVMMYEMLTGKVPFDRPNSVNILMAHIQEQVPVMGELNTNVRVPPPVEAVVRRCMAKNPDERYGSMDEVLVALKQVAGMTMTMSGEHRVGDMYSHDVGIDGFNPASSSSHPVHTPGDLLSGGTPLGGSLAHSSGMSPLGGTLGYPQQRKSKTPLVLGLVATIAVVGGFFAISGGSDPAQPATVRAAEQTKPLPTTETAAAAAQPGDAPAAVPAAPAEGAPAAAAGEPAAQDPSNAAVNASVLVSLRSTPPGATVVVGNKEYGPTPTQVEWTGAEAVFGREVTFRFQRKGYRDLTVTRQIRGDRLEVEAPPMDPIPVRRPAREERSQPAAQPKVGPVAAPLKGYKAEPY
jgi:serine/threonine-protein kinase